jgi:hypothetical protein
MSHDSVIDEVRATRDAIAREHNYDLDSIFRMLRTREAKSERLHVTFPPRPWPVATSAFSAARSSSRCFSRRSASRTTSLARGARVVH